MGRNCGIINCANRAERDKEFKYFRFPSVWPHAKNLKYVDLSHRRREAWLKAINRKDLKAVSLHNIAICSRHFISGSVAKLPDHKNPDWVPSLHLGYGVHNTEPRIRRNGTNRKVALEEPIELATHNPSIQHNQSKIAFEYVEIKQEPDSLVTYDQQFLHEPTISISASNPFIEPTAEPEDDSPPPSPITLYDPPLAVKRKWIENSKFKTQSVDCICIKPTNKPVKIDQACQTEEFYFNEAMQDRKDELIAKLKRENEKLKESLATTEKYNQLGKIPIESLQGQNKKVRYLTGFPNFHIMKTIFEDAEKYIRFTIGGKMSKFDIFFMTWMKLKLDLSLNYLSILMNISIATVSRLFYDTFVILYGRLSGYIVWPDKMAYQENTPDCYKQIFGNRRIIIVDCFNMFSDRIGNINYLAPSPARDETIQEISNQTNKLKPDHRPVKYLMCFSPSGAIIHLSQSFDTRCSKSCIAKECGLLNMIDGDDIILANRDFIPVSDCQIKRKSKDIIPMVKNVEGNLVELTFQITDEFTKIREDIEKRLHFTKQRIMVLTNRPPVLAVIKKYGEEMYSDFVIKLACSVVNLTPTQADEIGTEIKEPDAIVV